LTRCHKALLTIIAPLIFGLDELPGENCHGIDKVDAMREEICQALRLVPLEIPRSY
jgi:hypothetical protein